MPPEDDPALDVPMTKEDWLQAEVDRLTAAIVDHKGQRGDDRCWLDDEALYRAAGLPEVARLETALPPKCDFLASCERFWAQRQAPLEHGEYPMPGGMTIAQLTAEVERLRHDLSLVIGSGEAMLGSINTLHERIASLRAENGRLRVAAGSALRDLAWTDRSYKGGGFMPAIINMLEKAMSGPEGENA